MKKEFETIMRTVQRFVDLGTAPAIINFTPTSVPPKSSVVITQHPRGMFVGEVLVNTGDVDGLCIMSMWSGDRPQMETFQSAIDVKEFEGGKSVEFDLCSPFEPILFEVKNSTNKPLVWAMTLKGKSLPFWMALFR
jgi:hypothetical protein